jgi:hypothetical protein
VPEKAAMLSLLLPVAVCGLENGIRQKRKKERAAAALVPPVLQMKHQNVSFKFIFGKRRRITCVACVGLYIF